METKPKAIFSWSGGKDSAYALHKVLSEGKYEVKYLLTTINQKAERVSMHGYRETLLDAQAASINIPLLKIYIHTSTNEEYEYAMQKMLQKAKNEGIEYVIFGDIFLEDLREYREKKMNNTGLNLLFPLWKMNTNELITDFLNKKFKTVICCISDGHLDKEWVGTEITTSNIKSFPTNIDTCGENGEYHTFCYDGPIFKYPIPFNIGEKVYMPLDEINTATSPIVKGFWYCDLIPPNE